MPRFASDGFQNIKAADMGEAARVFALRLARKEYGRKGNFMALRFDKGNGASSVYEVYIGKPSPSDPQHALAGRNVWLYVRLV